MEDLYVKIGIGVGGAVAGSLATIAMQKLNGWRKNRAAAKATASPAPEATAEAKA